jgi:CDK-activating kinase assembly factor MAT1
VRGPDLLIRTIQLPSRRLPQNPAQEQIPQTNLRRHQCRARSRHPPARDAHVRPPSAQNPKPSTNKSHSLNRREEEFDSKRAYDDFLEQREEIIANLVSRIDVQKTEAQLQEYATENMASIRANETLEKEEATSFHQRISLEQEEARQRRQAARDEYESERREHQAEREDFLTRLAAGSSTDAAAIAREGHKVHLKKSSARRSEEDRIRQKQAALRSDTKRTTLSSVAEGGSGLVKGLRKIKTPEPEKPYDPFMGYLPEKRDYYSLQDYYPSQYLDPVRKNAEILAGGYDLREYYERTLLEAFAGLSCFVGEEIEKRDAARVSIPVATEAAAIAATLGSASEGPV